MKLLIQDVAKGVEEEIHVFRRGGFAHEADAPDFSFERAKACPDFDVVFGEEPVADFGFIGRIRDFDGAKGPNLVTVL